MFRAQRPGLLQERRQAEVVPGMFQPATTAKKARTTSGPTITHGDSWAW